jgi:hypothetical protein
MPDEGSCTRIALQGHFACAPGRPPPQPVVRGVRRDAVDPGRKAGVSPELCESLTELGKDLLSGVVSLGRPEQARQVALNFRVKLTVDMLKVRIEGDARFG